MADGDFGVRLLRVVWRLGCVLFIVVCVVYSGVCAVVILGDYH